MYSSASPIQKNSSPFRGGVVTERICSKIGGGFDNSPIDITGTTVDPVADGMDYGDIADNLEELVDRFAECTGIDADNVDMGASLHGIEGKINDDDDENDQYFYPPDHLGSSSFISDASGDAAQHLQYLPFGESFIDQRNISWATPYTFSAKEKDLETGYSYFGARYYSPEISVWLSVDPKAKKYPSLSPYIYTANNPILLVDPNGMEIGHYIDKEGNYMGEDGANNEDVRIISKSEFNKVKDPKSKEGTKQLEENSTLLKKYGEGIRIKESAWKKVKENGGERLTPYVVNNSNETVYYKPEGKKDGVDKNPGYDENGAYPIAPKSDLYVPVDGVNTSAVHGDVFKIPDRFPRVVISTSGVPDIKGILESIVPGIGTIDAPDSGWYKLRDSIKRNKMGKLKKIINGTAFIPLGGLLFLVVCYFIGIISDWHLLFYLYLATLFIAYTNVILSLILLFVKKIRLVALLYIAVNLFVILFYWLDPISLLSGID